jgi:BMFP domain-containing protein YqiC
MAKSAFNLNTVTQMLEQVAAMIPNAEERARLTNEKIVSSLKKIGIATREEMETLEARVAQLETELAELRAAKAAKKSSTKSTESAEGNA